jgi:hypothetical protein
MRYTPATGRSVLGDIHDIRSGQRRNDVATPSARHNLFTNLGTHTRFWDKMISLGSLDHRF